MAVSHMKTLRKTINIEKYISELNGYLAAAGHLNDAVGYRHGFFADLIWLDGRSVRSAIREYIGKEPITLQETDIGGEERIIEKYIFNNFLLGEKIEDTKNISFVKEQLRWHIQDYIEIAALNLKEGCRWVYHEKEENKEITTIFIKIGDHLAVMSFGIRKEDLEKTK